MAGTALPQPKSHAQVLSRQLLSDGLQIILRSDPSYCRRICAERLSLRLCAWLVSLDSETRRVWRCRRQCSGSCTQRSRWWQRRGDRGWTMRLLDATRRPLPVLASPTIMGRPVIGDHLSAHQVASAHAWNCNAKTFRLNQIKGNQSCSSLCPARRQNRLARWKHVLALAIKSLLGQVYLAAEETHSKLAFRSSKVSKFCRGRDTRHASRDSGLCQARCCCRTSDSGGWPTWASEESYRPACNSIVHHVLHDAQARKTMLQPWPSHEHCLFACVCIGMKCY